MKFAYGLPTILLGAASVIVLHQATVAQTQAEVIEEIAKQITVRIDGPKNGTGVIIDKQGNTYTVLTNWHVVQAKGNYTVQTQDGRRYQFSYSQVQRLSEVDLAQLTFTSNQNYRVADRGNSNQLSIDTKVYVAGWAEPDNRCTQRCWQFRSGNISGRLNTAKNGYTLSYTNVTKPGMSGGPLLDEEGRLLGINGQSQSDSRTGAVEYVAIPINTYVKLASGTLSPIQARDNWEQAKAIAQRGTASSLLQAIRIARRIPRTSVLRNDAYPAIEQWSRQILDIARFQGNSVIVRAIETAKLVPRGTAAYYSARAQIREWQRLLNR